MASYPTCVGLVVVLITCFLLITVQFSSIYLQEEQVVSLSSARPNLSRTSSETDYVENVRYGLELDTARTLAIEGGPGGYLPGYNPSCWVESLPGKSATDIITALRTTIGKFTETFLKKKFKGLNCNYKHLIKKRRKRDAEFDDVTSCDKYPYNPSGIAASCQQKETLDLLETFIHRAEEGSAWRMRCLPSVYLAGVSKSGTTDLFFSLTNLPGMYRGWHKEVQYWNWHRYPEPVFGKIQEMSPIHFDQYVDMYDFASHQINTSDHAGHIVDGSVTYLWSDNGWQQIPENKGLLEPKYISAMSIKELSPRARVILMLREPAARLQSFYTVKGGRNGTRNPQLFHQDVQRTVDMYSQCFRQWGVRPCAYNVSLAKTTFPVHVQGSLYAVFVRDWLEVFGRSRVFVVKSEDYYKRRSSVLQAIYRFLGFDGPRV